MFSKDQSSMCLLSPGSIFQQQRNTRVSQSPKACQIEIHVSMHVEMCMAWHGMITFTYPEAVDRIYMINVGHCCLRQKREKNGGEVQCYTFEFTWIEPSSHNHHNNSCVTPWYCSDNRPGNSLSLIQKDFIGEYMRPLVLLSFNEA